MTLRVCVRCNCISSYESCCDHPTIPTYPHDDRPVLYPPLTEASQGERW